MAWIEAVLCTSLLAALAGAATQDPTDAEWQRLMASGKTALQNGQYKEASAAYEAALRLREANSSKDRHLARSLYELGILRETVGRCDEAVTLILRGIRTLEGAKAGPAELVVPWQALGTAYFCQNHNSQAEKAYSRALELKQTDGRADNGMVDILSSLASVYSRQKRFPEAEQVVKRAEAILESNSGFDPRAMLFFLNNVGAMWRLAGRYTEAEAALVRATEILKRTPGTDDLARAYVWSNLAFVRCDEKQYGQAAALFSQAVSLISHGTAVWPVDTAMILRAYSLCLRKTGHKKEARTYDGQAKKILSAHPVGQPNPLVVDVSNLGRK